MRTNRTKLFSALALSLVCLTSCGKPTDITTYDLRKGYGDIKLSKSHNSEVVIEKTRGYINSYQNDTKYSAKLIRYYFPTNTEIKKPVSCLEAAITFVSTSFYIETTQTRNLADGTELATPLHTIVYSDGTNTHRQDSGKENSTWVDISSLTAVFKNMAKPTMYTYTTTTANIRGGTLKKFYLYEHYLNSQNQLSRIITDKDNNIRYYYERIMSNSYFDAYEFNLDDEDASIAKPII